MQRIAVPKASPAPLPEVAAYLAPLAPLFRRAESRSGLERYVTGLLTDLPRKNCEAIAAAVAGTSTERLQHLLTDADWDPEALDRERVRGLVAGRAPGGVLVLDETSPPKQGTQSVGVQRQYCGALGKKANCQVVVSAQYVEDAPTAGTPRHWPVSARLYLPEGWARDRARRERARVPAAVAFRTKPQLALELVDRARAWAVPFAAVVADSGDGDNPSFLAGLQERELAYVCGIESTFGLRLPAEVRAAAAAAPAPRAGRGRPKLPRPAPLHTVAAVVAALPAAAWRVVAWREGSAGPLRKAFAAVRVHRATGAPDWGPYGKSVHHARVTTGPEGWLLAERPLPGKEGDAKWYYSNLPADTPLERLVALAHSRWAVEQFYEEAKGECGLADHQGRRWDSLHRHAALVLLAYSFLVLQRAAPPEQGGLSPLTGRPHPPRRPPLRPRVAPTGPRPLVRPLRPDPALPAQAELTKQY